MVWVNEDQSTTAGSQSAIAAGLGADLTISSGAITITDAVHFVSGSGALATINGGLTRPQIICLIPKSGSTWTITTSGNIVPVTTTAVVDRVVALVWDGSSKWRQMSATDSTPTITSFANALHNHTNAAGGGQLTDAALSAPVGIAKGGTGAATASAARTALGLAIGSDVQAFDSDLSDLASSGSNGTGAFARVGSPSITSPALTSVNVSDRSISVNGYRLQRLTITLFNNGSAIQHRIIANRSDTTTVGQYASKVTGASTSLANTPTVAAGVDFTNGGGVLSGATHKLILNTAAQVSGEFTPIAVVANDNTGSTVRATCVMSNDNVNGTTRNRLAIYLSNASGDFAITTANIASGKQLDIDIMGYVA